MKPGNRFVDDMLDLNDPESCDDIVWLAGFPARVEAIDNAVHIDLPFRAVDLRSTGAGPLPKCPEQIRTLVVRAYGPEIVRLSLIAGQSIPDDKNPILEWDQTLLQEPLTVRLSGNGWEIADRMGTVRMHIATCLPPIQFWSNRFAPPAEMFAATVIPDGRCTVPFMDHDTIVPPHFGSLSLAYLTRRDQVSRMTFSVHAAPNESFAGTGERFAPLNLAGRTILLENADALGVNNRRAYKNVPFVVSSRMYGVFVLTSAHVRWSLADISTRASQAMVEDEALDLFFIGGGTVERIVRNYRRLTGFPRPTPRWSHGLWMGRWTYFSSQEVENVVDRLRKERFPCDLIHIDTGWFPKDFLCEWEFSPERFPDPAEFMRRLRLRGIRLTLWQEPRIGAGNRLLKTAVENRYLAVSRPQPGAGALEAMKQNQGGNFDFTNPDAVRWYQGLLARVLKLGAAVIKTDFGEEINMDAEYACGLPAKKVHNLHALLYQRAAWETTREVTHEPMIWARAGWAGCQRYPAHWGGDPSCTWDGMAGTLRGGLHLGVSGFGFWGHDVSGCHGLPNFMNNRPSDEVYLRWTQFGVFCSHMRYHGTSPREPYEYPGVADLVREWWKLRYALIPYLAEQSDIATRTGYPVLRAMMFRDATDPLCWRTDDQFLCGEHLLIAPIMNSEGVRDVYLPAGRWVDFWTGELVEGPRVLRAVAMPLSRLPVYAAFGAAIPVYPDPVMCTDEMDWAKCATLVFDERYRGFAASILGRWIAL
ncbi:MAG: glycoside hydrolase family 31 protein [Kiritimatiellae bacterium]|nr:glycoside hydrolase family 31 protein [Kiritimatiellia bacterium]